MGWFLLKIEFTKVEIKDMQVALSAMHLDKMLMFRKLMKALNGKR